MEPRCFVFEFGTISGSDIELTSNKGEEMKRLSFITAALVFVLVLNMGCSKDKTTTPTTGTLMLNINGLSNLGSNFDYEGWVIVNGSPMSTGIFTVDDNGSLSATSFQLSLSDLQAATKFVLTIEPMPDSDPAPSNTHYLAGDFMNKSASLTVADAAAFDDDFMSSTGKYILATPTNGSGTNENSGLWFIDLSSGSPAAGLNLPTLPAGWMYEGWAVINGTPLTTGKFTATDAADEAAPYSGDMSGPPFPGEDFLNNAPAGLTFPTDLAGMTAVITIEPDPDNSTNPFGALKPLVGTIPADATDHTTYDMNNNSDTFPSGTASWQ
jgi:hypothetical protein